MIIDHIRDTDTFFNFFTAHPMHDEHFPFEFLVSNPNLFCGYDEETGKLRAYINMYEEDGKMYLSGASIRHNLPDNINFIIKICDAFNEDIYADTDKNTARIVLSRAGFKRVTKNLYVRYKNDLQRTQQHTKICKNKF